MALGFSSCGDDAKDEDKQLNDDKKNNVELEAISFAKDTLNAFVGRNVEVYLKSTGAQLKAKEQFDRTPRLEIVTTPEDVELKLTDVKLTSDDKEVAVVNENGTITCKGPGFAKIKATVGNLTASCLLFVSVASADKDFLIYVEDVFSITPESSPARTVITGRVSYGEVKVGETVSIHSSDGSVKTAKIDAIEMFRKSIDSAQAGDNVGIAFSASELAKSDVLRGDAVTGSTTSYKSSTKFTADIYFYTKSEGGRSTNIPEWYRPQLFLGTVDRTCELQNSSEIELGTTVKNLELETINNMLCAVGEEFSLREGGRTIAKGVIKSIK